jgi:hypothetical protein
MHGNARTTLTIAAVIFRLKFGILMPPFYFGNANAVRVSLTMGVPT